MKTDFDFNIPLPNHDNIEDAMDSTSEANILLYNSVSVENSISPVRARTENDGNYNSSFVIDVSESEDDTYSPPPVKIAFTAQDTLLHPHGGDVENAIEENLVFNSLSHRCSDVEDLIELRGQLAMASGGVPSGGMDVANREEHTYVHPPPEVAIGQAALLAEQVLPDRACGKDDVPMMDVWDLTSIRDTRSSEWAKNVVVFPTGGEMKHAPAPLDGGGDRSTPPWMARFLQPDFLHNLMAYNPKAITLESDRIHISFA